MDTKRIEAVRAEMQGKYRMESVSVGTLSYLLDALLAPAASEPAQESRPCVFGQESDCSCSKHRCPKCSGPGSSRTLPCVDCAQEPERCDDAPARGEAGEPVREAERELTIVELRVQNADLRARLAVTERNMNEHIADKHRILREYEAQAQVLRQKLAEANAYADREARTRRTIEKERDDAVSECGAAMVRAEAAERDLAESRNAWSLLNDTARRYREAQEAAERRVEELTATLQKMAEGPCWFDGDENVEWDADERCSEEACFRCVAQHALADALAKEEPTNG